MLSCVASENDNVKQGVAHKTVAPVNSSDSLAGHKEVFNAALSVGRNVDTAVLIVKGGINKNGLLADVDAVFAEHSHHGGNSLFDGSLAVFKLDHGSVEPHGLALRSGNAVAAVGAFADYRSCRNIAGLERMHKYLAVDINKLCTEGSYLFGNKCAENLLGESGAGGVILEGVGIKQLCAHAVGKHKSVGSRAVMVGGGEALIMETSRAAGGDDDGLCLGNKDFLGFHIHKNSACGLALVVKNDLNCNGEVDNGNLAV